MKSRGAVSAALIASIAGTAIAQTAVSSQSAESTRSASVSKAQAGTMPTIDGVLSPAEEDFYGAIRWVNEVPTNFGDNQAGDAIVDEAGNPDEVTTGLEVAIPNSAIGNATSFNLLGYVTSGSRDFISNQITGELDNNPSAGNIGNPVIDWQTDERFDETDQFIVVDNIATATPTIDGTLDEMVYGAPIFVQSNFTGFGNNGDATPIGAGGSEIDAVYAVRDANNTYLFFAGNLEANGNGLDAWIDFESGGAETLGNGSGASDGTAVVDAQSGMVFDDGFTPDAFVSLDSFDDDEDDMTPNVPRAFFGEHTGGGDFDVSLVGQYAGFGDAADAPTMGDMGAPTILYNIDNSNTEGVGGSPPGSTPVAPDANFAYGSELNNVRAVVDDGAAGGVFAGATPGNQLCIFVGANAEVNFNKINFFLDVAPGGQNELRGDNVDISFGGLARMGGELDDDDNPVPDTGLRFDDGFEADYWFNINTGLAGGTTLINFIDAAVLRTDGPDFAEPANPLFDPFIADYGAFFGGDLSDRDGTPVADPVELIDFSGPQIDPQDGTAAGLFTQFAPREANRALLDVLDAGGSNPADADPPPQPGLLQASLDNSNVEGVTDTDASGAADVNTGIEVCIDLDELGWDGVQDILLAGWVAGSDFVTVSNQILGESEGRNIAFDGDDDDMLPDLDPNEDGVIDEVRNIDFSDDNIFPGLQYINLSAPVDDPDQPCLPADLAEPFGLLDGADVNAFITAFGGGDAAADLNDDGVVDGADVNSFITQFGAGCP